MVPSLSVRPEPLLSGEDRRPGAIAVRALLRVASIGYGAATAVRNALYDRDVFTAARVDARVVSVGNITAGGTGKTPVVAALAREYGAAGARVAILTRGYRSRASGDRAVLLVSDGRGALCAREAAGDEPWLLAERAPAAAVVLCPDRIAAARYAIRELGATVCLLDDGFQHRRLARDEDWVLVDALAPWGYRALLPRGLLRESLSSLERATTLAITRADQAENLEDIEVELRRYNATAPVVYVTFEPARLRAWPTGTDADLSILRGMRVFALSGIGNPEAFERTLRGCGADVPAPRRFPDHYAYTDTDLADAGAQVERERLDGMVTTEKDAVRLRGITPPECPLWVLGIDARFARSRAELSARSSAATQR